MERQCFRFGLVSLCFRIVIICLYAAGDMEFKQNKFLPAEKQIVTANPDINTVRKLDVQGLIN